MRRNQIILNLVSNRMLPDGVLGVDIEGAIPMLLTIFNKDNTCLRLNKCHTKDFTPSTLRPCSPVLHLPLGRILYHIISPLPRLDTLRPVTHHSGFLAPRSLVYSPFL